MATTQLKDLFIKEYYLGIEAQNSPEKTEFYSSGAIKRNNALDAIASNGQGTGHVHYWNDLDADEAPNITTDDPAQKGRVGKVTQSSLKARTLFLNKGYGTMDLTSELATSEPMQHIRNRFGMYWTRQWQRYMVAASKGIIQSNIANDRSDMVIDLSGGIIDVDAIQDAAFTAGDSADMFTGMSVHSRVMRQLLKGEEVEIIKDSEGKVILYLYLGRPVVMDDSLIDGDGSFITMLYGQGAFGYGIGTPATPVELERDASGGNGGGSEVLWERNTYILHPAGFHWQGEESPTKTPLFDEYAKPENWKREFDRKNIPFAAILSGTKKPVGGDSGGGLGD